MKLRHFLCKLLKNLRLSCSRMRIFNWSRTVLRIRSEPADMFLKSAMVKTRSLMIKWRSKMMLACSERFSIIFLIILLRQWETHVIRKLGHKQLLIDWWELIFQASPSLVTGHKVSETGRGGVQLLIKSIACSEPQRVTESSKNRGKKIQNGIYGWNVTFIENGSLS